MKLVANVQIRRSNMFPDVLKFKQIIFWYCNLNRDPKWFIKLRVVFLKTLLSYTYIYVMYTFNV